MGAHPELLSTFSSRGIPCQKGNDFEISDSELLLNCLAFAVTDGLD